MGRSVLTFGIAWLATLIAAAEAPTTSTPEVSATAATNAVALRVSVHRNVEGSYLPQRYAFVTAGEAKYTFLVPESYRVEASDPERVKIVSRDLACLISLSVDPGMTAGAVLNGERLRERVLTQFPLAEFELDHSINAIGHVSSAVDFVWKSDAHLIRKGRMILIPVDGRWMEFSLAASPEKFDAGVRELNLILQTFRSSSNGKFEYVTGSKYP